MHLSIRFYLLLTALLCGGSFAYLGMAFSRGVEPESFSAAAIVFWLLAGGSVASPLWLPAVTPEHFPRITRCVRWFGIFGSMALLLPLGSTVLHNVRRASDGDEGAWLVLAPALLLLLMCLAAVGVIFQSGRAVAGTRA